MELNFVTKQRDMAKTKITGFARLLIFLIFMLPLAFFGASYINGEDPIQQIKEFTNWETKGTNEVAKSSSNAGSNDIQALENRILRLERDLAIANEKLARCETQGVD